MTKPNLGPCIVCGCTFNTDRRVDIQRSICSDMCLNKLNADNHKMSRIVCENKMTPTKGEQK
jgi:hypothetical protein